MSRAPIKDLAPIPLEGELHGGDPKLLRSIRLLPRATGRMWPIVGASQSLGKLPERPIDIVRCGGFYCSATKGEVERHLGVHFACANCGSPSVNLPDTLIDESVVECRGCGRTISSWAEFKRRTAQIIAAEHGTEPVAQVTYDPLEIPNSTG